MYPNPSPNTARALENCRERQAPCRGGKNGKTQQVLPVIVGIGHYQEHLKQSFVRLAPSKHSELCSSRNREYSNSPKYKEQE
uniref:Uncharacterized protein n=1 Tax=Tolypothrix bouteillei VB521301 TaxID=1479485 RepID=A0A0C1R0Z6_9CYAN